MPDTEQKRFWYLICAKPKQEKKAVINLVQQGYECYLPLIKLEKIRRHLLTVVEEPLFPRYLFVQLDTHYAAKSWTPIRSTLGVSHMVRFGGEAAKVDERLIDILRMHEKAEQNHPQKLFTPGETVLIIEGPFAGLEAVYQMEDAESRAMILIELLSKPVKMSIEPENLRKVEVLPC